ncbi:hypothetical protein BDN67DRAFT_910816, partial [Paxillus ammoniavirescens]
LKVNYESMVNWRTSTDHLRCNPNFHGWPQYDCVLIQLTEDQTVFIQLIFMFTCTPAIPDAIDRSFEFALVQPYTARIGTQHRLDRDFKLTCIKVLPRSSAIFIPVESVIRGALLYSDPEKRDEFLVVDHIDGDMFLCMRDWGRL